jgi:hypothetical protein
VAAVSAVNDLMASCRRSAVHLEMRDVYGTDGPLLEEWRSGIRHAAEDRETWWRPWHAVVRAAVDRGAVIQRARIVSEPLSEYITFEHYLTFQNLIAGEDVRWLPRRQATGIALPGNDFWYFDSTTLLVTHFDGDGGWVAAEIVDDPEVIKLCASSFEAVWERALPHRDYHPA